MKIYKNCWWDFDQIRIWYRGKMVLSAQKTYWSTREREFRANTRAFHVGLKLHEHWNFWKISTYVYDISEKIEKGKSPLTALKEKTARETVLFQTYEVSQSFTASLQDDRTKQLIEEYTQSTTVPASLNAPMSARGKQVLKKTYFFIVHELRKGDPRGALKSALISSLFLSKESI